MPVSQTSDRTYQGRAQRGLDPETVTIEQLTLAANFLFAAMDGGGALSRGEAFQASMHDGASVELKARVVGMTIKIEDFGRKLFVSAAPKENPPSQESLMSAGIFLGRIMPKVAR